MSRIEAAAQARLAEAEMLLAQTQLRCARLVDEARSEAHEIVSHARGVAGRIVAEARAHQTGVDTRARESASFSELWAAAEDDHDADGFFLSIPEREAVDVFSA